MVDEEVLQQIRAALEESANVDDKRIQLEADGERVILRGSVSSAEEAGVAALVASAYHENVVNELFVDLNLREGIEEPAEVERVVPAENEVLVGEADMLAGPEAQIETDLSRVLEENIPWEPPDQPHLAPTDQEYGGEASEGGPEPIETADPDPGEVSRADYAAADLSYEDLQLPHERVPSLDPEGVELPRTPGADPVGVDEFGRTSPEEPEPYPEQVPGTPQGVGAVGEGTAGGGSISGVPATETGARGRDSAAADPVRAGTGGTLTDSGTERGPQAREDEPLREDFPGRDPEQP